MESKRNRLDIAKASLALFNANKDEFVTIDETRIHHHTPESKKQSKLWISTGETSPRKARSGLSANKVKATVFWDARSVIHVGYLEKGQKLLENTILTFWDDLIRNWRKKAAYGAEKRNVQVICETNVYFEDLEQSFFMEGIIILEDRRTQCIRLQGDYVEKKN